jgi:hypothetical protein
MQRSIRVESGKIILDDYPEGASARGLAIPKATELSRLHVFKSDIDDVCRWISLAKGLAQSDPAREALYIAALIKFRACFEGASGLRQKPLRQKLLFNKTDRACFEQLLNIRNRMVAHDEHLYPGEYPLIIFGQNAEVIEAASLMIKIPFAGMEIVDDLERLAQIAKEWMNSAYEEIAREIVAEINAIPIRERQQLRDMTPEFTITILPPEDRFKKA